jgi:DNA helicase-2/ATP-dependent DNA helicase PcrA
LLCKESGKPLISKPADRKLQDFCDLIDNLTAEVEELRKIANDETEEMSFRVDALPSFFKKIAERSGYLSKLKAEDTQEAESRIENIFELFNVAKDFSAKLIESKGGFNPVEFLERASLTSDLDSENIRSENVDENSKIKEPTVSLMTLHLAKGLEFEVVFFLGVVEGLIPHVRSLDDNSALEEERRLCYVGITRAKKQLYLSRALSRQSFGRNGNFFSGEPSRFIRDLPPELVRTRGSLG